MTKLLRLQVAASLLLLLTSRLPAQTPDLAGGVTPIQFEGTAFGTSYSIRFVPATGHAAPSSLGQEVTDLLDEIDRQMSLWRDDSELSRFNRSDSLDWFPLSEESVHVVAAAVEISHQTEGAFDPTVAPLVRLWSFGPNQQPLQVPTEEVINETKQHVGIDLLEVRLSPPAIRKLDPQVQLDLNAIAKGDAVDRVAQLLKSYEAQGLMVEIGGEVRTSGTHADGSPWGIGIERPLVGQRELQSILDLTDAALATSGDYRNYVESEGIRYSHTIDPRTGRPIDHKLASVSVVADDCMTADAWATALMVLGPEEGARIASANKLGALFLVHDGDGFIVHQTPSFPPTRDPVPSSAQGTTLSTFLLTAVVFGVAIAGMAIGVILSNRRLRGSCGGLQGLKDEKGNPLCESCTTPSAECEELRAKVAASISKPSESQ
ncbi:MAG: FAD:protein FMN transferase [Planctomycetaceae bacterium]|nr:FAD:protein FMN transferase [Planctomycetaceae bacterium]